MLRSSTENQIALSTLAVWKPEVAQCGCTYDGATVVSHVTSLTNSAKVNERRRHATLQKQQFAHK